MGFLTDIRSGERGDYGLGAYAIIFWLIAGLMVGGGVGAWVGMGAERTVLPLALTGLAVGLCVGFYAAFGATRIARVLAVPGALLAGIGFLVGL
ncbi:MAG: hypothetical protein WA418_41285 [Bradyrhizobium sp.]